MALANSLIWGALASVNPSMPVWSGHATRRPLRYGDPQCGIRIARHGCGSCKVPWRALLAHGGLLDLEISQCRSPLVMELFFSAGPVGQWWKQVKADSRGRATGCRNDEKGVSPLLRVVGRALDGFYFLKLLFLFSVSPSASSILFVRVSKAVTNTSCIA